MKELIISITPDCLIKYYKRIKASKYNNLKTEEVFNKIYKNNEWKSSESVSGLGSELEQTKTLRAGLEKLLEEMNISSLLDIPCGDFKWMQKVNLSSVHYTGADIVSEIIEANKKSYQKSGIEFKVLNLIDDPLSKTDLIIIRDCLVHLSYEDIFAAIKNIKSSGSKYVLTTTFVNRKSNYDIVTGDWRTLNLQKKPFNFPEPLLIINEKCTEANGAYKDKSMALWEIERI